MFISFFPRPKLLILSAIAWAGLAMLLWDGPAAELGRALGFLSPESVSDTTIGASAFFSLSALWYYLYCTVAVLIFAGCWRLASPHPWSTWSILGSALILFAAYFQVWASVAINAWYGPFYDLVQAALSKSASVTVTQFYVELTTFAGIAFIAVMIGVLNRFFVSHYIFRWRTAMNAYYVAHWPLIRHTEGASQRIQEDTMRFASTMEGLALNLLDAIMTIFAFTPVLLRLSANVTELPFVGEVSYPLVVAALIWSFLGTTLLALIGIRLPGLEFGIQRVEAAYRKELVLGEDDAHRAAPPTLSQLFGSVRENYFRLYANYVYFNLARLFYLQADNIFPYIVLAPTIFSGRITLGILNQILNAFTQVRSSLQYLVNSWSTIVELISIYKRLSTFEAAIAGALLPSHEAPPLADTSETDLDRGAIEPPSTVHAAQPATALADLKTQKGRRLRP